MLTVATHSAARSLAGQIQTQLLRVHLCIVKTVFTVIVAIAAFANVRISRMCRLPLLLHKAGTAVVALRATRVVLTLTVQFARIDAVRVVARAGVTVAHASTAHVHVTERVVVLYAQVG